MTLIEKALQFATEGHASINQERKSGGPYIVHPMRVAEKVMTITDDEDVIAAAYLHDLIEDVAPLNKNFGIDVIEKEFGTGVATIVLELTNQFTKERYPQLNRKVRKVLENKRIKKMSIEAKNVKLADIIDNCSDENGLDPGFYKVYIQEKREQLEVLKDADQDLLEEARKILTEANV